MKASLDKLNSRLDTKVKKCENMSLKTRGQ